MKNLVWAAVVAAVVLLTVRMTKGKAGASSPSGFVPPDAEGIRDGLLKVFQQYGRDIAQKVEQVYRLESNNWDSEQFRKTNTAGQIAVNRNFPFGWDPRGTVASDYVEPVRMAENQTGAPVNFVAFKRFSKAALFLAQVLKDRGGDPGKWKTLAGSSSYRSAVANIEPVIVNTF